MIKRILGAVALLLVILAGVLVFNTMRYTPDAQAEAEPYDLGADTNATAQLLSDAVRFQTVSTHPNNPEFAQFLEFIEQSYPGVHGATERVVLTANTPLYKWQGSNPDLQPVLLAAHYDVVPVNMATIDKWEQRPFDGTIADGFVWGRGTLDDKGAMIAMLSAVEKLIADGFAPKRTIYFSFGGDEEVGGEGAKAVAKHLTDQGIRLAWALDEGSFVLDGIVPGLDVPVASINLAEKGYVTVQLVAPGAGGHSSLPPRETAVGRLAEAIVKLQNSPVPGGLTGVSEEFFDALGRHFSFGQRAVFANRWLLNPVLEGILSDSPSTDAMLRSTTAPTMLSGSPKENVLATEATATINFRIHPRDTVDSIIEHIRTTIEDDGIEILVNREFSSPASPVSSTDTEGYTKGVEF